MPFFRNKTIAHSGKKWAVLSGSLLLAAFLAVLIWFHVSKYNDEDFIVATVNGDPVYLDEFQAELNQQRTAANRYAGDRALTSEEADTPSEAASEDYALKKARELALNECIRIKVEQRLGRDKGLIKDIGYPAFLRQLKQENERRKKAVENKEVIYGPVEYQKSVYFEYLLSNMELKLKEILENNEIKVTEGDLAAHYLLIKDDIYRKEGSVKIIEVAVKFTDEERNTALRKIEQVKIGLTRKGKTGDIPDASTYGGAPEMDIKERTFSEATAKQDAQSASELKDLAESLPLGKTSSIIEEDHTFYFIQCVDKEADGYKTFEEVKENVKVKYVDKKFQEYIEGLIENAKIEVNKGVYNRTKWNRT